MLILKRKRECRVLIGRKGDVLTGPIVVVVTDIQWDTETDKPFVKLGFDADPNIRIVRAELTIHDPAIGNEHEHTGTVGNPEKLVEDIGCSVGGKKGKQ